MGHPNVEFHNLKFYRRPKLGGHYIIMFLHGSKCKIVQKDTHPYDNAVTFWGAVVHHTASPQGVRSGLKPMHKILTSKAV